MEQRAEMAKTRSRMLCWMALKVEVVLPKSLKH